MTCKKTFWWQKHNWGKWEKTGNGRLEDGLCKECQDNTIPIGLYTDLERECKDCGYREIDVIKHKFKK